MCDFFFEIEIAINNIVYVNNEIVNVVRNIFSLNGSFIEHKCIHFE